MITFVFDSKVLLQVFTQPEEQIEKQIEEELRTWTHQNWGILIPLRWEELTGRCLYSSRWWSSGRLGKQIKEQARGLCDG